VRRCVKWPIYAIENYPHLNLSRCLTALQFFGNLLVDREKDESVPLGEQHGFHPHSKVSPSFTGAKEEGAITVTES